MVVVAGITGCILALSYLVEDPPSALAVDKG